MMEMFIEMWPEMREIIFDLDNKEHLLSLINNSLNSLVSNPSELNRVTDVLVLSHLFDIQDFKNLLADKKIKLHADLFERGHIYKVVKIDKNYPKFILNNLKLFQNYIE